MTTVFHTPVLRDGQTHRGPDHYKSQGSGHSPVIHKAAEGHRTYIVCHDGDLPEAISRNQKKPITTSRSLAGRTMYFYSQRDDAESRFRAMCEAQVEINRELHHRHMTTRRPPAPTKAVLVS